MQMSKALHRVLIILIVTCCTLPARAYDGWRVMPIRSETEFNQGKIGGEAEQFPNSMARSISDPNIIYLSHDVAQVWKSVNAGASWKRTLCKGLWLTNGQSIAVDPVDPNIVLVTMAASWNWLVTDFEGVYRSTDGGDNWQWVLDTHTNFGKPHRIFRRNITYDPTSITETGAQRWYVALPDDGTDRTNDIGLFQSNDAGLSWNLTSNLSMLPDPNTIYEIQAHPTVGQTVYVASKSGLYISTAQNPTLQPLGDLPSGAVSSVEINPQNPAMIYAGRFGSGLYRSLNSGQNFSLLKSFDLSRVFMNPGFPEVLYLVGQSSNTITSQDAGATWITDMVTVPAPGLARDVGTWKAKIAGRLTGIAPNPANPDEAIASSRATLWKCTDGGHTFVDSSTLFTGFAWSWWNDAVAFDTFDPDRFAFFNADVGMTITTNGSDWFEQRNDQAPVWYADEIIDWFGTYSGDIQPIPGSQIIVASVGGYATTQLMRSTNSGQVWELVTTAGERNLFIAFHPNDPNLVFAGDKFSTDAGATFSPVDFGPFNSENPSILGMCRANPDTLYALNQGLNHILRSDDRGMSWYSYDEPGWNFRRLDDLPTFAVDSDDCDIVYTLNASEDLAIFNGSTWRHTGVLALSGGSAIGNFVRTVAIDPKDPNIIYAGMHAAGVPCIFRSLDKGYTWEDISYNLPRFGMGGMAVNPHTGELFRGSPFGTWVFPPPYGGQNLIYDKLVSMPIDQHFTLFDFANFVANWLATACGTCSGADLTFDGKVLIEDFKTFVSLWLDRNPNQ